MNFTKSSFMGSSKQAFVDPWQQWLEATCRKNGWKHKDSPLVWRELVDQGGKGMLLGGFSEFLEHCQVGRDSLQAVFDPPRDVD